jgi:predicted helicase
LYYYRVPEFWSRVEKLKFLADKKSFAGIDLVELQPDKQNHWITEGMQPEFLSFFPMGTKETKGATRVKLKEIAEVQTLHSQALFKTYSLGVATIAVR